MVAVVAVQRVGFSSRQQQLAAAAAEQKLWWWLRRAVQRPKRLKHGLSRYVFACFGVGKCSVGGCTVAATGGRGDAIGSGLRHMVHRP
jgi:hypothetical protein